MANASMNIDPSLADYIQTAPAEDGRQRPITARIVGGRNEYGNVRKLPALLWKNYGIAVVDHVPPSQNHPKSDRVTLSLALIDQTSTQAKEEAKEYADQVIYTQSSWASISQALERFGIKQYQGRLLSKPPKDVPKVEAEPKVKAEPKTEPETEASLGERMKRAYQAAEVVPLREREDRRRGAPAPQPEAPPTAQKAPAPSPIEEPLAPAPSPAPIEEPAPAPVEEPPVTVMAPAPDTATRSVRPTPEVPTPGGYAPLTWMPAPEDDPVKKEAEVEKTQDGSAPPELSIPQALEDQILALLPYLNTPAVRAVTGRGVDVQFVFELVLRRGIEAVRREVVHHE